MFLISPNQLTYYKADDSDPWLYRWIEFNGSMSQSILKSVSLNESTPIYTDDENNSVGNALCNIISSGEMCFELLMQNFGISFTALQTANKLIPSAMPKNIFKKQKHL